MTKRNTDTSRISRFINDYEMMVKYVALMSRIFENMKKMKKERRTGKLTFDEWNHAEKKLLTMVQNEAFSESSRIIGFIRR